MTKHGPRPPVFESLGRRFLFRRDVQIIKDLRVLGEKSRRHEDDALPSGASDVPEPLCDGGFEPRDRAS